MNPTMRMNKKTIIDAKPKHRQGVHRVTLQSLVPTGRLELPRLTPLPPQDSVSTNFTTSALSLTDTTADPSLRRDDESTLSLRHFGTSPGVDVPAGAVPLAGAPGTSPGARVGDGTSLVFGAGTVFSMTPCSIKPCGLPFRVPKNIRATFVRKKIAERI